MFLGTSRIWWIAAAIPLVLGIALIATGGGTLGTVVGVLLIFLAMVLFAMSPMRYGRDKPAPAPEDAVPPASADPSVPESVPRPRPAITARDASDV